MSNLTLEEIIQLDLPDDAPNGFKNRMRKTLTSSFVYDTPPLLELHQGGHITRQGDAYRFSELAAQRLAEWVRTLFNEEHPVTPAGPTHTPAAPKVEPEALTERLLGEVLRMELPAGYNQRAIVPLATRISTAIARKDAPYDQLLKNGTLTRTYNSKRNRQVYTMTPTAAGVIARVAVELYEEHYAPKNTPKTSHDTPTTPADAPEATTSPQVTQPGFTDRAPLRPRVLHRDTQASTPLPHAQAPDELLPIQEAVNALARRYSIPFTLTHDQRLNLMAFIVSTEQVTNQGSTPLTSTTAAALNTLTRRFNVHLNLKEDLTPDLQAFIRTLETATRPTT